MGNTSSNLPALQSVANCNTELFMGTWFVIGVKPTIFEKTNSNAVERYTLLQQEEQKCGEGLFGLFGGGGSSSSSSSSSSKSSNDINIDFQYNEKEPITSPLKSLPQKGWVQGPNKLNSGLWTVSPLWPIKMPYQIIEVDEKNYSYCVIGYPNRQYCWIMARTPQMAKDTYSNIKKRLVEKHHYNLDGLRDVPQKWTKEERTKRGLTSKEIPDSMLVK